MTSIPRRKHRWLRWLLAGIAALLVLGVGLVVLAVKLQPTTPPLTLPAAVAAPVDPTDGTYHARPGSVAGFRIQQTVFGMTSDVVGRTDDVTGTVTVAGNRATSADLRINLLALTTGGQKPAPQFGVSLDTARYPDATLALAGQVPLESAVTATGTLTLHGVTRTVTVPLRIQRNGAQIDVLASLPVAFTDYGLSSPKGYGWFGSLADHGTAELLLVLGR